MKPFLVVDLLDEIGYTINHHLVTVVVPKAYFLDLSGYQRVSSGGKGRQLQRTEREPVVSDRVSSVPRGAI